MCIPVPVRSRVAALVGLLVACGSAGAQPAVQDSTIRVRIGDDPTWAQPDLDDSEWEPPPIYAPPDSSALLWIRIDVQLEETLAPGLALSGTAAREVYWDGVLIGTSGRVGTNWESERAGPIDATVPIPDSLAAPGPHVVALRLSAFRCPPPLRTYLLSFGIGDLRTLTAKPLLAVGVPLVFLGGFVLIALYYGVLYTTDRRRTPYLLTSLLCLAVAALLVTESWRTLVGYTYDLHVIRLRVVTGLTATVGLLLSSVFVAQFRVPRGGWILGLLTVSIGGIVWSAPSRYDTHALAIFAVSLIVALGLTTWATVRRQPGAWVAAGGVATCLATLLATGYDFPDSAFFPSFSVLLAGLLVSLGMQTREARRQHEATLAEAARLEAELLKKHLQPHFLMNALTSVMEWVETDPKTGTRALAALSDELRALSDISQEKLISMDRELALCRAHLEVMSFRREVDFALHTEGIELAAPIPPAVIHTLVENAITHNAYASGSVELLLREEQTDAGRRLTLRAPLASSPQTPVREGGGLRYVRARLAESFPGDWSLSSGAKEDAWVTRIDLPASS